MRLVSSYQVGGEFIYWIEDGDLVARVTESLEIREIHRINHHAEEIAETYNLRSDKLPDRVDRFIDRVIEYALQIQSREVEE